MNPEDLARIRCKRVLIFVAGKDGLKVFNIGGFLWKNICFLSYIYFYLVFFNSFSKSDTMFDNIVFLFNLRIIQSYFFLFSYDYLACI